MPILLFLKALGMGAGSWLSRRSLIELACIALALFAGIQTIRVSAEKRHSAKLETQLHKCADARAADRKAYESAQREAAEKNKADIAQIEQKQERINETVSSDYQRQLADLRKRMRPSTPAAPGSAGKPGISQDGKAAGGSDGDGLHLSPNERLQAAEIELRLLYLQRWILEQGQLTSPHRS